MTLLPSLLLVLVAGCHAQLAMFPAFTYPLAQQPRLHYVPLVPYYYQPLIQPRVFSGETSVSAPISNMDPRKRREADRIQAAWSFGSHFPSKTEVERAALLAQEEYLTSVKHLEISNMDISDIPSDQMDKLASIVTEEVMIENMTPASRVSSILASVQCPELWLWNMKLYENTQALVTAMRDRVQGVWLDGVTLDIEELTQYDGQGRCSKLWVWDSKTKERYGDRLRGWAADKGWTLRQDNGSVLVMERK